MTAALTAVLVLIIGYGALLLLCRQMESRLIFFPTPLSEQARAHLETGGAGAERIAVADIELTASDGVALHGWYCTARSEVADAKAAPARRADRPVVLLLHGNGGNISNRSELIRTLVSLGADVFALDYRGYGRSEGSPTGEGVHRDARAAWQFLTGTRGVPAERIVLFGESLGGAVAIHLAADVDCGGLIVESSFTSLREMAARRAPIIPPAMIRTRMDSLSLVDRVRCPKLFFHGTDDGLIPISMGRRLYERSTGEKRFVTIEGAGHNDVQAVGGEVYRQALADFLSDLYPAR